jgi:hypothetical protein
MSKVCSSAKFAATVVLTFGRTLEVANKGRPRATKYGLSQTSSCSAQPHLRTSETPAAIIAADFGDDHGVQKSITLTAGLVNARSKARPKAGPRLEWGTKRSHAERQVKTSEWVRRFSHRTKKQTDGS